MEQGLSFLAALQVLYEALERLISCLKALSEPIDSRSELMGGDGIESESI